MNLGSQVVLDRDARASAAFAAYGTPTAILIDASGRIASELAIGAEAVMRLVLSKDRHRLTGLMPARTRAHRQRWSSPCCCRKECAQSGTPTICYGAHYLGDIKVELEWAAPVKALIQPDPELADRRYWTAIT